jgi:hypothetical protein
LPVWRSFSSVSARWIDLHRLLEPLAVAGVVGHHVGVVGGADRDVVVVQVQDLAGHRAAADAEHAAAVRQVVQRGEVLGELERVPLRHDVEHRAESHVLGLRRDPGGDEQAVGDDLVALVLEVVLGGPEAVVAEPVGGDAGVDVLQRRVPARLVVVVPVHRGRTADALVRHLDATEEERSDLDAHVDPPRWLSGCCLR